MIAQERRSGPKPEVRTAWETSSNVSPSLAHGTDLTQRLSDYSDGYLAGYTDGSERGYRDRAREDQERWAGFAKRLRAISNTGTWADRHPERPPAPPHDPAKLLRACALSWGFEVRQ